MFNKFMPSRLLLQMSSNRWMATNVKISSLEKSEYVKTYRINFKDEKDRERKWDCVNIHDSVAVILFHVENNSLLLVRQFRPAVFVKVAQEKANSIGIPDNSIDFESVDIGDALTLELCAGILDKTNKSVLDIVKEEIKEECGFDVPPRSIAQITKFRGVGVSGNSMTLFYAEIDNSMKVTEGGGNISEAENIECFECPVDKIRDLLYDPSKQKPPSLMFALLWFLYERKIFLNEIGFKSRI